MSLKPQDNRNKPQLCTDYRLTSEQNNFFLLFFFSSFFSFPQHFVLLYLQSLESKQCSCSTISSYTVKQLQGRLMEFLFCLRFARKDAWKVLIHFLSIYGWESFTSLWNVQEPGSQNSNDAKQRCKGWPKQRAEHMRVTDQARRWHQIQDPTINAQQGLPPSKPASKNDWNK